MKKLTWAIAGATLLASGMAFAAGGSLKGTVSFSGTAPKMEQLKRNSDPFCAKTPKTDEAVVLSKDGKALKNVVVRITNAPAGGAAPTTPVHVDQKECMYSPRVVTAVEGQKVEIQNSDGTLHNVHSYAGAKTLFNQAQPPRAKPIQKDLKGAEIVKLKCDVHPWMTGYIVINKNPYITVTGEDGSFELKDVPAGKYTVEAWHEVYGTKTAEVTVEDGKPVDPKLAFAAK